jgi:hypothetical protein
MVLAAERLEDQHEDHEDHEDHQGRDTSAAARRVTAPSWSFVIFVVFV